MSRYALHPQVWEDIREIWEFIAQNNPRPQTGSKTNCSKPLSCWLNALGSAISIKTLPVSRYVLGWSGGTS